MGLLQWLPMFFVTMVTCASQQCQEAAYSQREQYLKGHEIWSGSASHIGDCLVKCSNEPRCKSINVLFKGLICELNDADRFTHPWDYRPGSLLQAYSDYPKVRSSFLANVCCLAIEYILINLPSFLPSFFLYFTIHFVL